MIYWPRCESGREKRDSVQCLLALSWSSRFFAPFCNGPRNFLTFPLFVAKPFILQQLIRGRPIPPVHHHDFPDELLVPLADLRLRRLVEWCFLRSWDLLHEVQNSRDGLWFHSLLVFRREGAEVLKLPLENLQPVLFMAVRDGARPKKVEVAAIDPTYKL
jgi:hypothetical protein